MKFQNDPITRKEYCSYSMLDQHISLQIIIIGSPQLITTEPKISDAKQNIC